MSQQFQLAHSRNCTLQKQLEYKYHDLRRTFRYSRRRLDTMEEDCVASLYRLLLYTREKMGHQDVQGASLINDVFRRPKSDRQKRPHSVFDLSTGSSEYDENVLRPVTAMSAKTYTQSYSFMKDGMNIDKTRRARYLRTKEEKERQKENNIKIARLITEGEFADFERPETVASMYAGDEDGDTGDPNPRPKTAGAHKCQPEKSFVRPQTSSIVHVNRTYPGIERTSTPNTVTFKMTPFDERTSHHTGIKHGVEINGTTDEFAHKSLTRPATTHGRLLNTPTYVKMVHENSAVVEDAKSPITVRVTTIHDARKDSRLLDTSATRLDSQIDHFEEELIPLADEDKEHLEKLTTPTQDESHIKRSHSWQNTSQSKPERAHSKPVSIDSIDHSILKTSMEKTSTFLKQYSKKSKVFGYVVKTRSSIIAPRERIVSHKSPCITYQELVSIKASIKQQASKTKSLLQRSAKLSTYVDKLATAGDIRQRMKELKEAGTKQ